VKIIVQRVSSINDYDLYFISYKLTGQTIHPMNGELLYVETNNADLARKPSGDIHK